MAARIISSGDPDSHSCRTWESIAARTNQTCYPGAEFKAQPCRYILTGMEWAGETEIIDVAKVRWCSLEVEKGGVSLKFMFTFEASTCLLLTGLPPNYPQELVSPVLWRSIKVNDQLSFDLMYSSTFLVLGEWILHRWADKCLSNVQSNLSTASLSFPRVHYFLQRYHLVKNIHSLDKDPW